VDVESEMVHVNALPERVSADPQFTAMGKLLVVYCVSEPGRPYVGYELLQALLSAGLRFGENNVFHRYTGTNNRGTILFSFASAHEPGTFDIQKMGSVVCRGLCCFMQLTNEEHNIDALDGLLTTAYQLTQDLGGALLDGDRNPFDSECYDQYRYQIARFQQERQIP
jgi:cell division protein ZipA